MSSIPQTGPRPRGRNSSLHRYCRQKTPLMWQLLLLAERHRVSFSYSPAVQFNTAEFAVSVWITDTKDDRLRVIAPTEDLMSFCHISAVNSLVSLIRNHSDFVCLVLSRYKNKSSIVSCVSDAALLYRKISLARLYLCLTATKSIMTDGVFGDDSRVFSLRHFTSPWRRLQ